jgi:CO/xanthine dehydrogenase Mo-binding subunit
MSFFGTKGVGEGTASPGAPAIDIPPRHATGAWIKEVLVTESLQEAMEEENALLA